MATNEYDYLGWRNYETWNVSLWLNNDYESYIRIREYKSIINGKVNYKKFIHWMELEDCMTPDGVKFMSYKLSYRELNYMLNELY